MAILDEGHVTLSNCYLSNNRADVAMMSVYNSRVDIDGSATFKDNIGSMLAFNSTVTFTGETTFYNCSAAEVVLENVIIQEGGAISAYSSRLTFLTSAHFNHNSAKYCGALFAVESILTFMVMSDHLLTAFPQHHGIQISNNTATITGGGL